MDEKKHARFCKVAEKRVNQIIEDMEKLGNCSSRASYQALIQAAVWCPIPRGGEQGLLNGKKHVGLTE